MKRRPGAYSPAPTRLRGRPAAPQAGVGADGGELLSERLFDYVPPEELNCVPIALYTLLHQCVIPARKDDHAELFLRLAKLYRQKQRLGWRHRPVIASVHEQQRNV